MQKFKVLFFFGIPLAILTILFSILGLTTSTWIIVRTPQIYQMKYGLFHKCLKSLSGQSSPLEGCQSLDHFKISQYLLIIGVVILSLTILLSILIGLVFNNRYLGPIVQMLILVGPTLMLIASLLYVQSLIKDYSNHLIDLSYGYSLILIVIVFFSAYFLTAFYLFIYGLVQGYHYQQSFLSKEQK